MSDLLTMVGPALFKGGKAAEYLVKVLSNGGLGTLHVPSGSMVPHVLAKAPLETLAKGLPVGGPTGVLQAVSSTYSAVKVHQMDKKLDTVLQGMQTLQGLSIANLGVGLLNLGVSAWTAWKVHKMDKKLDAMTAGVQRVETRLDQMGQFLGASVMHLDQLIRGNSLLLGEIIEHQGQLGQSVALLREEVARGFRSVHDALVSAEARNGAQELEQQMRSIFRYYELCTREMQEGRQPPASDMRRIIDVATGLIAWLDTRLASMPAGSAERLPLFVARAFALRLEVEARQQLGEAPEGRIAEFEVLRSLIRGELNALTDRATLFALAKERRELIEQYIYLARALTGSATIVEFEDGSVVPFYRQKLLVWDDGLDSVRIAASRRDGGKAPLQFEIKTLEEHQALQRLMGLPRGGTKDVVEREVLARSLGIDDTDVTEVGMRELLRVGPTAIADAKARIKGEFD